MQTPDYHQYLNQQMDKTLGISAEIPDKYATLFWRISETYKKFDNDYGLLLDKVETKTAQLIASTSNAYSFLDSLHMGFIMCDVNAEVVITNHSVQRILDSKMSSVEDFQSIRAIANKWSIDTIDNLMQPDIQLKESVFECLNSTKPIESKEVNYGKRVLHVFIAPLTNKIPTGESQKIGAVILVEDITEQKILERSKDEFLSIASHELRTPLTAIRGNASLIKNYYLDSIKEKDVVEIVDDIHESSVRLIEIVNDFLDASAIEQDKIMMNPEPFSLKEVIDHVSSEIQNMCDSKSISLIIDPSVLAMPEVFADKQRIKQVVYNLVGNAVKFTEKGKVTIKNECNNYNVYTYVSDTGKGIPEENQSLLFRKFQQAGNNMLTRDNTKGTGLGLYICKLIIDRSRGKIELQSSKVNQGSTFMFSLPRHPSKK